LDENGLPPTVAGLLQLANKALAGASISAGLDAINEAVSIINEAFDECAFLVICPGVVAEPEPVDAVSMVLMGVMGADDGTTERADQDGADRDSKVNPTSALAPGCSPGVIQTAMMSLLGLVALQLTSRRRRR